MNPWIEPDADVRCVDGCGRIATDERLSGLTSDAVEVVELVCVVCRDNPADEETPRCP